MTTHDELFAAIDQAGGNAECPSCGANEWMGMGRDGNADRLFLMTTPTGDEGPQEVAAYGMFGFYCNRCGLVRLHRPDALGLA